MVLSILCHHLNLKKNNNRLGGKIGLYEQEKFKMYQIDNIEDVMLCEAILKGYGLNGN